MRAAVHLSAPPPHPGVILRDFVLNAEVTQKTLADALRVSRYSVNQIVNGRRAITADMAIRLGRVLSTTPEFWMNLQREVDLYSARQQLGDLVDQLKVVRSPASVP